MSISAVICRVTSCSQLSAACTASSADANVGCRRRDRGNLQLAFRVEQVLHELHRVLPLFFRLLEEQLRQQRQLTLLEVRGDADVLHAGAEFVADLLVEGVGELGADQHDSVPPGWIVLGEPPDKAIAAHYFAASCAR